MKKGEIKAILISAFEIILSDFPFHSYKNQTYYFQRRRPFKNFTVTETLDVIFSLKDKNFSCSVSSRLNPSYVFDKNYNTGNVNPSVDLIVLKTGVGAHFMEDAYYFYNGQYDNATKVVNEIATDFKKFGISFLNKQFDKLSSDRLLNFGFSYISQLTTDKMSLKKDIDIETKNAGYVVSRIKHPIYVDLKEKLQSIPDQAREERQNISRFAFEMLELYCAQ